MPILYFPFLFPLITSRPQSSRTARVVAIHGGRAVAPRPFPPGPIKCPVPKLSPHPRALSPSSPQSLPRSPAVAGLAGVAALRAHRQQDRPKERSR